ncbi:HU domain-containing protein [Kaistella polysaccharea]|uniref:HU domain-containing protein n=1 Tax=Kaistella polysaccharea TaxID=2878534 RepID=UPI001CF22DC5|nr:hypothetical protein [Kaistella polysaccharea]
MNFSHLLLEFLKKKGSVSVAGFGTFYLHTINATFDEDGKNILPPGNEIAFDSSKSENHDEFLCFLADQKNIGKEEAEKEIAKQVTYWNSALEKNHKVEVENLGSFYLEDSKLIFSGNRLENLSPAFFGLEEINISEIKKGSRTRRKPYTFVRILAWLLPLGLLASGLTYVGLARPEIVFGKKSILTEPPQKDALIVNKDRLKSDSINTVFESDSIIKDSIIPVLPPVKTAKKWTSKSYKKNKWKKSKKRQNR